MKFVYPNWVVPENIAAVSTTRIQGESTSPYAQFNLGLHVGDNAQTVIANRNNLSELLNLPNPPVWLNQTHSTTVKELTCPTVDTLDADATVTDQEGVVCCVMTADCLPILLTDTAGEKISAVHAGWRGLADGILENAIGKFNHPVIAWIGPAISWDAFEVGAEILPLLEVEGVDKATLFKPSAAPDKWFANLPLIAEHKMRNAGVSEIFQSGQCTFTDQEHFYSYRRDGVTGRQATLIWKVTA